MMLDQGVHALEHVLAWADRPHLVHCTGDLHGRIESGTASIINDQRAMTSVVTGGSLVAEATIEDQLISIWREFLGIEEIGIGDEFFELGGDSLLAMRLLNRMREVFPGLTTDYSMRDFFDRPTIEAGASRIRSALTMARLSQKARDIQQENHDVEEGIF